MKNEKIIKEKFHQPAKAVKDEYEKENIKIKEDILNNYLTSLHKLSLYHLVRLNTTSVQMIIELME